MLEDSLAFVVYSYISELFHNKQVCEMYKHIVFICAMSVDETSSPVPQIDGACIMDLVASSPILIDPPRSRTTVHCNESIELSGDEHSTQQKQTDRAR